MTRKEIIAALESIHAVCTGASADGMEFYVNNFRMGDFNELLRDTAAMLSEQPRLLTEEDFLTDMADSGGAIPCWKEPVASTRREGWAVIVYGKWYNDRKSMLARYWTGKPTEEQKAGTPWE